MKEAHESGLRADGSLIRRSAWTKGAGASAWLAAVRLVTSACGAAWIVRDWAALPRPELALAGLFVVAVSALFCWRPPVRAKGFAEAATVGVVALLLVGLNGGAGSPLVTVWLGTARTEIVSQALVRDADRRYDPILVVDEAWRLVEAITIEELLQESTTPDEPLRLAAEG